MIPLPTLPGPVKMQQEVLPASVDMRPNTESVDDQKALGSCVAHAAQTALEIARVRAGVPSDLSRLYLYYFVQLLGGTLGSPSGGGYTYQIGEVVERGGVCLEATWPYNTANQGVEPPQQAMDEGLATYPKGSTHFERIGDLADLKSTLARGMPVMLTMYVHRDLLTLGNNWRTHEWDIQAMPVGLHCVCAIGYDDACERVLIENSWGSSFGDGGFFGIPYSYFASGRCTQDYFAFDRLPHAIHAEPGYTPAEPASYDQATQILSIPTLDVYMPGSWAAIRYTNVVVKILDMGRVSVGDAIGKRDYFISDTAFKHEQHLGLQRVNVNGVLVEKVLLIGAKYELVQFQPPA